MAPPSKRNTGGRHRWIDVRKNFANFYGKRVNVEGMLRALHTSFEVRPAQRGGYAPPTVLRVNRGAQGRPHSGLDDTRNIARILLQVRCVVSWPGFFFCFT